MDPVTDAHVTFDDALPDPRGLTAAEVAQRLAAGHVNRVDESTTRTFGDIVRANVFTRFNAILGVLLVVILVVGPLNDALFGIVLVSNAVIGIVQETRAKRTLDRLAVLSSPRVRVIRDGHETEIAMTDVVRDDLCEVASGDQIVVDGDVVDSQHLEVDESLLTGESDPIPKRTGDRLQSGSFVVAGSGRFVATDVGPDSYANKLASEARRFSLVASELRDGIDRFLRVLTWFMIPTAIILVISQIVADDRGLAAAARGSVAGIGAIVPEGLVLLTSLAFAVGGIRLARRKVLIQELAAIEGLARVDVICLDKTGTLTESALVVSSVEPLPGHRAPLQALGALHAVEERPNASLAAIGAAYSGPVDWRVTAVVPFSSARRWSGATYADQGTWLIGAPDTLANVDQMAPAVVERLRSHANDGRRVLMVAHSDEPLTGAELPARRQAVSLIVLSERVRPEAAGTLAYFAQQGVAVKVISGDDPATVAAVARDVGVIGADHPVDGRTLPDDPEALRVMVEANAVFGRVGPHQKRAMVRALQSSGHTVAMTGDGVNDVLALKDADIGVAMGAGTSASRAVARLVLLENNFAVMPDVVGEGRRVIANVERVANLFITKSIYALVLALSVGLSLQPFPFFPRQLTIVSSLTIGIPAFFLALAPARKRAQRGFVGRVLRFSVPAGVVAAAATYTGYRLALNAEDASQIEAQTVATIVLFCVAMWVLAILARPFTVARGFLVGLNAAAFGVVLLVPGLRDWFALNVPSALVFFAALGVAAVACGLLEAGWQVVGFATQYRIALDGGRVEFIRRPSPVTADGGDEVDEELPPRLGPTGDDAYPR